MRYKSSQEAVASQAAPVAPSNPDLHYTKSGQLDMRYKTSREVVQKMEKLVLGKDKANGKARKASDAQTRLQGVPSDVPVTKDGAPNMQTNKAKDWVKSQAQRWHPAEELPAWVPRLKDGSPDLSKAVARHFLGGYPALAQQDKRDDYYERKRLDQEYEQMLQQQRDMPVEMVFEPVPVQATAELREAFANVDESDGANSLMPMSAVIQFDFDDDLELDDDTEPLAHGSFGTVYKGKWNDKQVAIKKLHAAKLTKKERKMFTRETIILGMLGDLPISLSCTATRSTPSAS
ncbi:hypothetical protein V7S43_009372 [Phytophthora oleae]|uniref:Protein kinase domain-containing protein n=1 Tax=Phytophthora oleae TaxID=2107226 RepID=A0ABD3FHF6_9STRA